MNYANQKVLVTGGGGFIGSRLVLRLRELGAEVSAPSHTRCDLTYWEDVVDTFHYEEPTVVFHTAGNVGGIEDNRLRPLAFMTENLQMGVNVVEACMKFGVDRLINLGSACSYPKHAEVPVSESSLHEGYPEETNGPYGIAKRTIVDLVDTVKESGNMDAISVISTNCYGPGDNSHHVIPDLIRKFLKAVDNGDSEVSVWGSGEPTRDFLYVDDLIEGLICAGSLYHYQGPVNVGSDSETSIKDLVKIVSLATEFRGQVSFDTSKPDGQPRRLLDIEKATRAWGFAPSVKLEEGIEKTVKWIKAESEKKCGQT